MKRILFATGNAHKMEEIREILSGLSLEIVSLADIGLDPDVDENGSTFEENARIKAAGVAEILRNEGDPLAERTIVMADDSGLEIDYLNGEPGIFSARYMGENTSYRIKNAELIRRLEGVPDEERTARFVCAIAAVLPDGRIVESRGTIEGRIGYEERGSNGFGYDPIFCLPGMSTTTAELAPEEKNAISHRGKALRAISEKLRECLNQD